MLRNLMTSLVTVTRKALVWNTKDLRPPTEQTLLRFNNSSELSIWDAYSDSKYGGLSTVVFHCKGGVGIFTGVLSLDRKEEGDVLVKRSGFAGLRTKQKQCAFDLTPFDVIAMRVKGDGRSYLSTIRTENWIDHACEYDDNTWQAYIKAPKDVWQIVKIPLDKYLPTYQGRIMETTVRMNPSRVVGFGFHVAALAGVGGALQGPGPFKLEIDWVKAESAKY